MSGRWGGLSFEISQQSHCCRPRGGPQGCRGVWRDNYLSSHLGARTECPRTPGSRPGLPAKILLLLSEINQTGRRKQNALCEVLCQRSTQPNWGRGDPVLWVTAWGAPFCPDTDGSEDTGTSLLGEGGQSKESILAVDVPTTRHSTSKSATFSPGTLTSEMKLPFALSPSERQAQKHISYRVELPEYKQCVCWEGGVAHVLGTMMCLQILPGHRNSLTIIEVETLLSQLSHLNDPKEVQT